VDRLELRLPSGLALSVSCGGAGAPVVDDRFRGERFFSGRLYRALDTGALVVDAKGGGERLGIDDLDALSLPDYHALRDAAFRVGAIDEEVRQLRCRNCDVNLPPRPEHAPTLDLDHWYVDAEDIDLSPLPLSESGPKIVLRVTTAGEARAFHRAALRDRFRLSPAVVKAMGIVALDEVTSPAEIARALEDVSDEEWSAVEAAYEYVAYSPKSYFPVLCPSCETLHDMPAPAVREVDSGPLPDVGAEPFPDEDAFAGMALSIGDSVYREMGVENIELEVVCAEAAVDGSGEPLLGSYQPLGRADTAGYAGVSFLICVYYRTFARMYEDGPYDVEAELRETIEHEVQHHLHHLEGHDPMDAAERDEAMAELERTYGKRAVQRAKVADAVAEAKNMGWLAVGSAAVLGLIVLFLYLTGRL